MFPVISNAQHMPYITVKPSHNQGHTSPRFDHDALTLIMGHPGQYDYSPKSLVVASSSSSSPNRSQSLPSCFVKNHHHPSKSCQIIPPMPPTENNPSNVSDSWFRTWPERGVNNNLITNNNNNEEEEVQEEQVQITGVPLEALLEKMQLAYSPLTRQLHLVKQPPPSPKNALQAIAEEDSSKQPKTSDASSSFSSMVSSLSDASSPVTGEPDLDYEVLVDKKSSSIPERNNTRRGISGFFTRNVFPWRSSANSSAGSSRGGGWRFFSRNSSSSPADLSASAPRGEDSDQGCDSPASIRSYGSATSLSGSTNGNGGKKYENVVASSSALILHARPDNLPAKPDDEETRHRKEYERMVAAARKKEAKEARQRRLQLQQQLILEEQLASAVRVWTDDILPKWDSLKHSRRARDLWWQGLPPCVRGKVWRLAIGNELNVTRELYDICVGRAQERLRGENTPTSTDSSDLEASVQLIQLDIARTFPNLCIFQKGGPYYDALHLLLGAYACYRPDVGYVQGMSFVAAVLILNLEPPDAFVCFANLLNRPCHLAFYRLKQDQMEAYYATYDQLFRENLPRLHAHFDQVALTPDLYLLDWVYTVFAKAMPLDVASRVWDVFLRDGEAFLFRTALGVLHLHQEVLLNLDFVRAAQLLSRLPDDLSADELFKCIDASRLQIGRLRFADLLANNLSRS